MSKLGGLHYKTAQSKTLNELHDKPRPTSEIAQIDSHGDIRPMVCSLKPPGQSKNAKSRPNAHSISYLYGDERRAVRAFIEENTEYVESCIEDGKTSPLGDWDDVLYQILLEEWDIYNYTGGDRDE